MLKEKFELEYTEWMDELNRKRKEMARLETEMKKIKLEEEGRRLKEVKQLSINYSGDLNSKLVGIQMVQNSSLVEWFIIQIMA